MPIVPRIVVDYPVIAVGDAHGQLVLLESLLHRLHRLLVWPQAALVFGAEVLLALRAGTGWPPCHFPFGWRRVSSSGSPVSSRLLRLDRMSGQPPDTAWISFDSGLSIS